MSEARIRELLAHLVAAGDLRRVGDGDSLLEAGVLDSAVMIELLGRLEEAFDCSIGEDELTPENFHSIAAIADLVRRKRAQ
jgi:acyl carrier protein